MVSNHEIEIENLINSGLYKVVNLGFLKDLNNIELNSSNKEYLKETLDKYKGYLKMLEELPKKYQNNFLQTLKKEEINHNQEIENEDTLLLSLFRNYEKVSSIDIGSQIIKRAENFRVKHFNILHNRLMNGTFTTHEDNFNFRKKNSIIVEGLVDGNRDIHFIPLNHEDINKAVELICSFLNEKRTKEEDEIKALFTSHVLIAAIQSFDDGNTRLARLIFHLKLWDFSKRRGLTTVNLPAIYLSKSFYFMRFSYRDKIRNVVVNPNPDSWNSWYTFNLNAFNEQLDYLTKNLTEYKRRIN